MTVEVKRRINAFLDLSSTVLTTLYTCPTNRTALIKEIFICNVDTTNSTDITLAITDTSASTTFNLIKTNRFCKEYNYKPIFPSFELSIDNATMIGMVDLEK